MLSWGALLGGGAQYGYTPLFMACKNGHMEVVKLLLARSDIAVNQATVVRRVGRERGQGGRAWVNTTVLRRRAAHLTAVRVVCGTNLPEREHFLRVAHARNKSAVLLVHPRS
jgi:ankyrin repeat protein